jgi:Na+/melibiose symporter-like transporter
MKIWAFKKKDGFSCDDYGYIALAVVAMIVVYFYPLTKKRVAEINEKLKAVRATDITVQ